MANPNRGAVAVRVGDEEWTFSFSVNALCELEEHLGEPISKILLALGDEENLRISYIRALVWAALLDHHEGVTLEGAGDVATSIGPTECLGYVSKALERAFPTKAAPRPRKAKS